MSHKDHYRDHYVELKSDLKRKKRELEEADDRARKCEAESKKAKIESQEILKLYHGLQREMQLAYERNAKLQVDKVSLEELLDNERKEFDQFKRQQSIGTDECKKLKDALCAMKTEKLDLEAKFNAIVMENKELRDRARQYEPRLREMDEIKKKLAQVDQMINDQLQPEIREQNEAAQRAQVRQEQLDRYAQWNTLLRRECQQKTEQVKRYDELVEYARRLEEDKAALQLQIDQLNTAKVEEDGDHVTAATRSNGSRPECAAPKAKPDGHVTLESDGSICTTSMLDGHADRVSMPDDHVTGSMSTPEGYTSTMAGPDGLAITSSMNHQSPTTSASNRHPASDLVTLSVRAGQLRVILAKLEQDFRQEVASVSSQLFTVIDQFKKFSSIGNEESVLDHQERSAPHHEPDGSSVGESEDSLVTLEDRSSGICISQDDT